KPSQLLSDDEVMVGEHLEPALISESIHVGSRLNHIGEQDRVKHAVEVPCGMPASQEPLDAVEHRRGVACEEQMARLGTGDPTTTRQVLNDVSTPGRGSIDTVDDQRWDGDRRQHVAQIYIPCSLEAQ